MYVERDQLGNIKGCYGLLQPGYAEEFLADDDPAVVAFLNPGPSPDEARRQTFDSAISGDTTLQQLKAMTAGEFSTWFDANVTTAAQAIQVLKRLAFVIIRRVL